MIRAFCESDLNRVMQLWLSGNLSAHSFIPQPYWQGCAPCVRQQLLHPDTKIFVAVNGDEIQGFAGMQRSYLAGIFVEQSSRSQGVGKQLLDYVKSRFPTFSLKAYRQNHRAVSFYLREGLTIVSEELDEATGAAEYTMEWRAP